MAALPNFFSHLNNISREELPKVEERAFKDIFEHFNGQENSLGTGSNHSRVYRGKFQRRPIAIKRVLKDLAKIVDREVSTMLHIDPHPNILKYLAKEETEDFIYIGMELCEYNLATFVSDQKLRHKMPTKSIFQQTAEGLKHLHQLSISKYWHFSSSISKFNLTFQFIVTSNRKTFWFATTMEHILSNWLILSFPMARLCLPSMRQKQLLVLLRKLMRNM